MMWERLTPQQSAACDLLCRGYHPSDIARELRVKLRTVKNYLRCSAWKCGIQYDPAKYTHIRLAVLLEQERMNQGTLQ